MTCYSEHDLERFVLNGTPSPEEEKRWNAHLATCVLCSDRVRALRAFYRTAADVPEDEVTRLEAAIQARLQRGGGVFAMRPAGPARKRRVSFKLAADSERVIQRYETLQTFTTAGEELLARLVRDHAQNQFTLFVIPDREDAPLDFCMNIPGWPGPRLSDSHGRIDLSDLDETHLKEMQFTLKSPVASFDLQPFDAIREELLMQGRYTLGRSLDLINLELVPGEADKSVRLSLKLLPEQDAAFPMELLLTRQNLPPQAVTLSGAHVQLQEQELETVLTVKVYEGS